MKTAAQKTGLSPHVIRIWEKRYGAVEPGRTNTNRRLYSDLEVARLALLHAATRAGYSIGNIARLDDEQLRELVGNGLATTPEPDHRNGVSTERDERQELFLPQCIAAIQLMDSRALDAQLRRASLSLGCQGLLQKLVAPLAQSLGELWRSGEITAAQEHFASNIIRLYLGSLARPYSPRDTAPNLIVATPAGQLHELGAVLVAAAAANHGWHVTYLGTSLPAVEIASSAIKCGARAIALSLVYPTDDHHLPTELASLRQFLPPGIAIIAGGRATTAYHAALRDVDARFAGSLDDLYQILDELRELQPPAHTV